MSSQCDYERERCLVATSPGFVVVGHYLSEKYKRSKRVHRRGSDATRRFTDWAWGIKVI